MSSRTDDTSAKGAQRLRLLFVDDEAPIRNVMGKELRRIGHEVTLCEGGQEALDALLENSYDAAIVDLRMPDVDGWDVIKFINDNNIDTEIIISTGHGDMDDAIRAIQEGAYDFLRKPYRIPAIDTVLKRLADKRALQNRAQALETELINARGETKLIGETPPMERVKTLVNRIAPTDSGVLILGETGTGKEVLARRIHELSSRSEMPFVAVNCGALPENLVESELFGHKKGAFTGADTPHKGLIEVAKGGTLFLDELGELDKTMQVKLLRFLESGEIRPLGETESFTVDVRIVCATNRDLEKMSTDGDFREDLFFRVNTFEIRLPALRDRRDDIPLLADFLAKRAMKGKAVDCDIFSPAAIETLRTHDWRGNVRELANAVEHAVLMANGNTIEPDDLPSSVSQKVSEGTHPFLVSNFARTLSLREIEMEVILQTLEKHGGDKPKTADQLGIALKTLYNKLNQYQSADQAQAG